MLDSWREALPDLISGAQTTMLITVTGGLLAVLIGLVGGVGMGFGVPGLAQVLRAYVELVRGTPLLVQIFFLFFGVPVVTGISLTAIEAGMIIIGVHHGAYFSEIVRGALASVPAAQIESSRSLGMSWMMSLREVVGPQALLHALPSMGNQLIICLKDTSLLAVIGVNEVTREGQIIIANTFLAFETWVLVALVYLCMTSVLGLAVRLGERRLGRFLPERTSQ